MQCSVHDFCNRLHESREMPRIPATSASILSRGPVNHLQRIHPHQPTAMSSCPPWITMEEDRDWLGMTAEHYAHMMLEDIRSRVEDAHQLEEDTPTRPQKRMSYSASIKALEVAYRALFHTAMASNSHIGVLPPNETQTSSTETKEVKKRKDEVRGLHRSIREKLQAVTFEEDPHEETEALIRTMLEENQNRCAWSYVAKTAHKSETEATTMSSQCADAGRQAMEQLLCIMDGRVNRPHEYH